MYQSILKQGKFANKSELKFQNKRIYFMNRTKAK